MSTSWTRAIQGPELLHQMSCKGKWIPKFLIIFFTGRRRSHQSVASQCRRGSPVELRSARNLRQARDAPNTGRYAETAVFSSRLHADHRGLTTYPTLFSIGELSWEHQHHLQFTSHENLGIRIEEDPARTQVPGISCSRLTLPGSDRDTQTHGYPFAGAAVRARVGHRTPRLSHAATGEKPATAALKNRHVFRRPFSAQSTATCLGRECCRQSRRRP